MLQLKIDIDLMKLSPKTRRALQKIVCEAADEITHPIVDTTNAPPPQCGPGETCP